MCCMRYMPVLTALTQYPLHGVSRHRHAVTTFGLKLDLNYNFKTDGFITIAKALTPEALGQSRPHDAPWLEQYPPMFVVNGLHVYP